MTKAAALSRRLWWSALIVLVGMAIMIRLGFWQLDRLAQRRAANAALIQQLALPPLSLAGDTLPVELRDGNDLTALKNRSASARGTYDFSHQVVLKLQSWQGEPGAHLITPLLIEGSSRAVLAVLVDRGWVPYSEATPDSQRQFDEPGPVTVTGRIELSQPLPAAAQPGSPQTEWYRLDIAAIQAQMPYPLLPITIQQSPPPGGDVQLPYRVEPVYDLSDGPHLSYAIQWYSFAVIFGGGYVYYVYKNAARFMPHKENMLDEIDQV